MQVMIQVTEEEMAALGLHFRGMLRMGVARGEFSALNRVLWKVLRATPKNGEISPGAAWVAAPNEDGFWWLWRPWCKRFPNRRLVIVWVCGHRLKFNEYSGRLELIKRHAPAARGAKWMKVIVPPLVKL